MVWMGVGDVAANATASRRATARAWTSASYEKARPHADDQHLTRRLVWYKR